MDAADGRPSVRRRSSRSFRQAVEKSVRLVTVEHEQQRSNWDCGVSCVMMMLHADQREYFRRNRELIADEEGYVNSTWTIDLAYLLKRFGIPHRYRTVTVGIDPSFQDVEFYGRILRKDEKRVLDKMKNAQEEGVIVEEGEVALDEILNHLDQNGPVIVLTNAVLLYCANCGHNQMRKQVNQCLPCRSGFEGHYIVAVGYNLSTRRIYYRNPALKDRICVMDFSSFEDARTAYGTDEDVLFVYFKNAPKTGKSETGV